MARPLLDLSYLSPDEKVQLAEELWDSLAEGELELTEAQGQELDRRLDAYRSDGDPGTPWAEALRSIEEPGG